MTRIKVKNLKKEFKIGFRKDKTFLSNINNLISGKLAKKQFIALDDINFELESGQVIGIIGSNGSGKTTLLRIIAGIHSGYEGRVTINGRITTLIGLAIGLNERLTLKENTFLAGSLLGMSFQEVRKKFDSIVKFAELEDFVDTKLYQFSAGMRVRLAIAIVLHTESDIILADEIFAFGDEHFKNKIQKEIKRYIDNGGSMIVASHKLDIIEKYSDKVIWLEKGKIIKAGPPQKILEEYKLFNSAV